MCDCNKMVEEVVKLVDKKISSFGALERVGRNYKLNAREREVLEEKYIEFVS